MCDFTPDIPKLPSAPPPQAPNAAPKLADPLAKLTIGMNPDGTTNRKKGGLSSLRIDRTDTGGLNVGQ